MSSHIFVAAFYSRGEIIQHFYKFATSFFAAPALLSSCQSEETISSCNVVMKKFFVVASLVASSFICPRVSADVLAQWTFEVNTPPDATDLAAISGILADVGTGTGSALHASAATDWTTPAGNGSTNSLSGNTWGIGDYFQFSLSTLNYTGVGLTFDQVSSSTGPRDFYLAYSTDGSSFAQFGSGYVVLVNATPNNWSSGTAIGTTSYSFDLSSITALDNAPTVYFRLVDASTVSAGGATVATGGTSRVDNFTITATAVPEPGAFALVGGFGLLMLFFKKRPS